ncbi:hypothetical protein PMI16_01368 [Herbaspirillum sp. CF444]|uniref:hypothetical protein n=1 Tax=Herbaspirillum sp. CF444 TaxID=1144319 RepID=UPI0002724BA0|nr:hypothetical protein [Herbaspirillum sp. CF444]EJL91879.1 hypothetical protein PMI16_01368 [Herbaspirillum sp. CF444]
MSNASIQTLHDALNALRDGDINVAAFCTAWRAQSDLLKRLPPRYEEVAEDLLGRLEAGSLFTEESCSFSQEDLLNNLAVWLHKAEKTLV